MQWQSNLYSQSIIYRALATNQDDGGDNRLVHRYNKRGEDSENRIVALFFAQSPEEELKSTCY